MKKKVGSVVLAVLILFVMGTLVSADSVVLKDGTMICNYKNNISSLTPTIEICSKRINPNDSIWFNLKKEGFSPVWTYFLIDGKLVDMGFYKLSGLHSTVPVSLYNNGNWPIGRHMLTIIMTPIKRIELPYPWAPFTLTNKEWLGYPPCGYVTITNSYFRVCYEQPPCCCH